MTFFQFVILVVIAILGNILSPWIRSALVKIWAWYVAGGKSIVARIAVLLLATVVAAGFGSLVAAAFIQMIEMTNDIAGYEARIADLEGREVVTRVEFASHGNRISNLETREIGFGPPQRMIFDVAHRAPSAGLVSATLDFSRVGLRTARASACGYVGPSADSLSSENRTDMATLLTTTSMQCRVGAGCGPAGVYIPLAGLSMPVQEDQWWIVADCGGDAAEATEVYFHELTVGGVQP